MPRIRDDISEYKRLNFHLYMVCIQAFFFLAVFLEYDPTPRIGNFLSCFIQNREKNLLIKYNEKFFFGFIQLLLHFTYKHCGTVQCRLFAIGNKTQYQL